MSWPMRFLRRLWSLLDEALPMSPGDRAERDWTNETGDAESARRKQRLKLLMLEKRGKGGYR